jgi:hypothetical protein
MKSCAQGRFGSILLAVVMAALVGAGQLVAQGKAYVTGYVMDPSGAVVPGASVVVIHVATGTKYDLKTGSAGLYRTPELIAGDQYRIEVSAPGFKTLVRTGVVVHLGEVLRLDFGLEVGASTQSVEVTGTQPILNTQSPAVGQLVEEKAVDNLPLQDRRAGGLIALGPGVNYEGQDPLSFYAPRFNMGGSGDVILSVDGATGGAGRVQVDQLTLNPPLDAVKEVQIQQGYHSAEYGGEEGGIVRMTTKSGTNQFHGTGYEYFRNEAFDSRQFFAASKQPDNYNLYGGSVGGPIKKDRAFFFVNIEGTNRSTPDSARSTVPTVAMRNGDFSGLPTPIYDPATTRPDPNNPGGFIRDQFPGNMIPSSRFDPVAVRALSFLPDITTPGANNYHATWTDKLSRYGWAARFDYNFSPRDQFSATSLGDRMDVSSPDLTPAYKNPAAVPEPTAFVYSFMSRSYIFSETHTFSPSLVNTIRFAYRPQKSPASPTGEEPGWDAKLGLKNVYNDQGFPAFRFSGYMGIGPGFLISKNWAPINTYEWHDVLTFVRGKHTVTVGGDIMRSFQDAACADNPTGSYNFDQRLTALPGAGGTGDSIASFLLGEVSGGSIYACPDQERYQEWYAAPYVTDSFHVARRFTLDLGLRWELDFPLTEDVAHQGSGFDPYTINPVSGTPGVVTFQGERGVPPYFYHTDWDRFEPRIGFAYQLDNDTVIRGGYGIYGISIALGVNRPAPGLGFNPVQANFVTPDNGLTPAFLLSNGFPAWARGGTPAILNDAFGAVSVGHNPTTNVPYVDPYWDLGYAQNFTASVQRELPGQILFELAGIGSLGRKLPMNVDYNQLPPNLWGVSGNRQSLRPYPQFGSVIDIKAAQGITNYYGLNVKLTKRYSHGLTFITDYTWQKELGVMNFSANSIHSLDRGETIFEQANAPHGIPHHLLRFSAVYDLPAGPGKHWLTSGPASWALGGWTVGGILTFHSGYPFGLGSPVDSLNCFCGAGGRLNQVGDLQGPQTLQEWFNTAAVAVPAFGTIGTLGVSNPSLIGPDFRNLDLSLSKTTRFKNDRYAIKFMLEIFNSTNTTKFGLPNGSFSSPSFGEISGYAGVGSGFNVSPPWNGARIMQMGFHFEF